MNMTNSQPASFLQTEPTRRILEVPRLEENVSVADCEPFSLQSKVTHGTFRVNCKVVMPQKYDEKEIVPLTIARTGSTTLTEVFKQAGMHHVFHNHACTLADVAEQNAKRVVVTLRDPLDRFISGYQRKKGKSFLVVRQMAQEFSSLNQYMDALRIKCHGMRQFALDAAYSKGVMFMQPVTQYYLGVESSLDFVAPEGMDVSFICTCALDDDLAHLSKKWDFQFEAKITHQSSTPSDEAHNMVSEVNQEWIKDVYAEDLKLFRKYCGHCRQE
jgi:hypothetical protein